MTHIQRALFEPEEAQQPQPTDFDAAVYCPKCNRLGPRDWWHGMDEPPMSLRDDEPEFECIYCGHIEDFHLRCAGGIAIREDTMRTIISNEFRAMRNATCAEADK